MPADQDKLASQGATENEQRADKAFEIWHKHARMVFLTRPEARDGFLAGYRVGSADALAAERMSADQETEKLIAKTNGALLRTNDGPARDLLIELRDALASSAPATNCYECSGPLHGPFCPACNPSSAGEVGWREIESAPKDGTHFLLAFGQDVVAEGWWDDGNDIEAYPWRFVDTGGPTPAGGRPALGFVNGGRDDHYGPTHWQPLPSPPDAKPDKGGVRP